jgi:hypothetical protein
MKTYKLLLLALVLLNSCTGDQDDNLANTTNFIVAEIIRSDSNLFNNLKDIASSSDEPHETITCINFNYPLTIFVFSDTDQLLYSSFLSDDNEFSELLNSLEVDNAISVSFPISSTLASGEEFLISTKEELEESINNCLEEELIFECNGVIQNQNCVLKVGYSYNDNNPYLGSIFNPSNGLPNLNIDDTTYIGSWTALIIEQELHINISLNDTTEVGDYFNFDWKVEYLDGNSLILTNEDRELVLNQRCDDDYKSCGNFVFEVCETTLDSGISDFILDDYSFCIFDTLELDETFEITYHETEDDALNNTNAIVSSDTYSNITDNQSIFVRLYDAENDKQYFILINLKSIGC